MGPLRECEMHPLNFGGPEDGSLFPTSGNPEDRGRAMRSFGGILEMATACECTPCSL